MVITVYTSGAVTQSARDQQAADLLYEAWCVIANARDWPTGIGAVRTREQIDWEAAAVRWRDSWHSWQGRN